MSSALFIRLGISITDHGPYGPEHKRLIEIKLQAAVDAAAITSRAILVSIVALGSRVAVLQRQHYDHQQSWK